MYVLVFSGYMMQSHKLVLATHPVITKTLSFSIEQCYMQAILEQVRQIVCAMKLYLPTKTFRCRIKKVLKACVRTCTSPSLVISLHLYYISERPLHVPTNTPPIS